MHTDIYRLQKGMHEYEIDFETLIFYQDESTKTDVLLYFFPSKLLRCDLLFSGSTSIYEKGIIVHSEFNTKVAQCLEA